MQDKELAEVKSTRATVPRNRYSTHKVMSFKRGVKHPKPVIHSCEKL